MTADPFHAFAARLAEVDASVREDRVRWADPLFGELSLERKVVTGLVAEAAGRRLEAADRPLDRTVLVVDLVACGGSIALLDLLRRAMPAAGEIAYLGFGAGRGGRALVERGIEGVQRRSSGPTVRTAFCSSSFLDAASTQEAWDGLVAHYDWVLAVGLDGRVGRTGAEPLGPPALAPLASVDTAVVSFLDAGRLASVLPRLGVIASSLGRSIEIRVEVIRDGRVVELGEVEVTAEAGNEEARLGLCELLDGASRFAHRARLRPSGGPRAPLEVVECFSRGFAEDHLLGGLDVVRFVPSGAVLSCVTRGAAMPRRAAGGRVPSQR